MRVGQVHVPRVRLAAAALCVITAGMVAWAVKAVDDEPDRWIPTTLAILGVVAALSGAWIFYAEYRGRSSGWARDVTALALAFAGLVLLAWTFVVAGIAWCAWGQPCGG